ncbi:MAG: hypothetical protein ACOX6K_03990 [Sphaerochaetaceae bacterium]|jgi:antitoxin component YwqK of YwqJK toxin-antitoxin module
MNKSERICLLLLSAVLLAQPTFAQTIYRSNSIGQRLEEVDGILSEGWSLVMDGNDSTLYQDSVPVKRIRRTSSEERTVSDDGDSSTRKFKNGSLLSLTNSVNDDTTTFRISYDDQGHATGYTRSTNGNIDSIVTYLRAGDGSLSAIERIIPKEEQQWEFFLLDGYVRQTGDQAEKITRLSGNLIVKERLAGEDIPRRPEILSDADGNLVIISFDESGETIETTYAGNGLVLKRNTFVSEAMIDSMEFFYDETGDLTETLATRPASETTIRTSYENGLKIHEVVEDAGLLSSEVRYHEDGTTTETLYEHGKPYADVRYGQDGKRVLSVSYR